MTSDDNSDDNDQPPAEAEHFIVLGRRLQTGHPEAYADDDCPPTGSRGEDAIFASGAPVPRALAEKMWAENPFPWPLKTLLALDENGDVVGGAGGATSEADLDDDDAASLERYRNYWKDQR